MAERRTLICDVCGTEEAINGDNEYRWYAAIVNSDGSEHAWRRRLELSLLPGAHHEPGVGALFHLCGAACVTLKVSEFLGQKALVQ